MPESSTIRPRLGESPHSTTRPFQNCSSRTRPSTSPMPELSIKGTWEKSRRRQAGFTFWAVSSMAYRISRALWWSISPESRAVSTPSL